MIFNNLRSLAAGCFVGNSIVRLLGTILIAFLSLHSTSALARAPTAKEAAAIYCAQSDKLALQQLKDSQAKMIQFRDEESARKSQAEHKSRIDKAEAFIRPTSQFDIDAVEKATSLAIGDFQLYALQTNACAQACKDSGCIGKCLSAKSALIDRVMSCLHPSW